MNGSVRASGRTLAGCAALVAALLALLVVPASSAAQSGPGSDYLALGDSIAYGYQAARFNAQFPNVVEQTFNTGYVDRLGFWLRLRNPSIETTNDGCPGESTESFIRGGRGPGTGFTFVPNPAFCGDSPRRGSAPSTARPGYTTSTRARSSQMRSRSSRRTRTRIRSRSTSGRTTCSIFLRQCGFGAVPGCITPQSIGALYARIGANMATILGALRAAAPQAEIVVLGLYNAYPTLLPGGDADGQGPESRRCGPWPWGTALASPTRSESSTRRSSRGAPEATDIPTICVLPASVRVAYSIR